MLPIAQEREALDHIIHNSNSRRRQTNLPSQTLKKRDRKPSPSSSSLQSQQSDETLTRKKTAYGRAYSESEESLRSDFTSEYIHSGRRPQNFLLGVDLDQRFNE